jgi:carbonic anhydrase
MQKLVKGIHDFQNHVFRSHQELFERLARGQSPDVLFITCSDSRVVPNLITQTDPGDLFVIRNAGNIIPPYGTTSMGGEAATIEYAIEALDVQDIVVCGHSACGAMAALPTPEKLGRMPTVAAWLKNAEATRRIMAEKYRHLEGDAFLTATVEENVLVQLENLRTHPAVAARIATGKLRMHGWVYKIETGRVFAYDPAACEFLPIDQVSLDRAASGRLALARAI